MNMNAPEKSEPLRKMIECGAEIAGGAVGGAIGFLFAGPVGAAVGGAGGAVAALAIKHIGQEVSERCLGPRERTRIGAVLALATAEIHDRTKKGEKVRDDDFFKANGSERPKAEEVAESILMKSQKEAEEKKLPYMAHLLANIAFDRNINSELAHQIIKIAEQLTYRQLCILKLSALTEQVSLRKNDFRGQETFARDIYQLLYEILDLYHRGLINFSGEVLFGPTDVAPAKMRIQGLGQDMFNLMNLASMPNQDLLQVADQLK